MAGELQNIEEKLHNPKLEHSIILFSAGLGIILFFLYLKNQGVAGTTTTAADNNATTGDDATNSTDGSGTDTTTDSSDGQALSDLQSQFTTALGQITSQNTANNTALQNSIGAENTAQSTALTNAVTGIQTTMAQNNTAFTDALTALATQVSTDESTAAASVQPTLSLDLNVAGSGNNAGTYQSGDTSGFGVGLTGKSGSSSGGLTIGTSGSGSKAEQVGAANTIADNVQLTESGYSLSSLSSTLQNLFNTANSAQNVQAVEADIQPPDQPDAGVQFGATQAAANSSLGTISNIVLSGQNAIASANPNSTGSNLHVVSSAPATGTQSAFAANA